MDSFQEMGIKPDDDVVSIEPRLCSHGQNRRDRRESLGDNNVSIEPRLCSHGQSGGEGKSVRLRCVGFNRATTLQSWTEQANLGLY